MCCSGTSAAAVGPDAIAWASPAAWRPGRVQGGGQHPGIERRLREAQCEADKNANCLQPGGAAADTMPFEGLNLFVSTDYQHKVL